MNECDSINEYRCNDGQCIDQPYFFADSAKMFCLEEILPMPVYPRCLLLSRSACENLKCPRLYFSCGDGDCYDGPIINKKFCHSQRDQSYQQKMISTSSFIFFSHITLIYNHTKPEYICYNETLCPYLSLNNSIKLDKQNGLTCRSYNTFTNRTYNDTDEMIKDVKYFIHSCSLPPLLEYNSTCSLFRCHDQSKCLSFHRIFDGFQDCQNGEDENPKDACTYNLTHRFMCDDGTKCIPLSYMFNNKVNRTFISVYDHFFF